MNVVEHPSDGELVDFSAGKLNVVDSDRIERHLANCDQCCQTLSNLPEDTLVVRLRDSDTKDNSVAGSVSEIEQTVIPDSAPKTQAPDSDQTSFGENTNGDLDLPAELVNHPRYRIVRLLGHGGMGDVYLAEHKVMNRMVALKVIKPQLVQNDSAVRRFRREVQAAARLHHPNIVAAYDAEQAGDLHYLVMEFVDGVDLNEVLKERGEMPVNEALDLIHQAAVGLGHAHELGMVHRDIKPHNLMVTESTKGRTLKILDFGLANFASETAAEEVEKDDSETPVAAVETLHHLTQMGTMMGTPDYIAPEQAQDAHTADIRADIYSLGCTFFTLLTGRAPFGSGSVLEKIKAHNETDPPPISDLREDVPPKVTAVLSKMMAKSAADRYQTPQELVAAISATLAPPPTKPTEVRPAPPKSRTASWIVGGISIVGLIALLAFGCLAAMAVVVVLTDRGKMTIVSEVDDVDIVLKDKGKVVKVIDLKSGTTVYWLDAGHYNVELKGDDNDVKIDTKGFQLSRMGHVIVKANWTDKDRDVFQSFDTDDKTITWDGVKATDGAFEITSTKPRTVRLFETDLPRLRPGPFHYRAKLKSKGLKGRAYLEMWVRIPGLGESFSRGLDQTVTGTNDWAEFEIPFYLRKGQVPDQIKLNLVVEGAGVVSIKDIELRGRIDIAEESIVELPLIQKFEGHVGPVKHVSFSPNGKLAASASGYPDGDRTAIIWDIATGKQLHQLVGHKHTVMCAEFSLDGKQLATSSYDGSVRFWNVETGEQIHAITGNNGGEDVAYTPDGKRFASATYTHLELRDTKPDSEPIWSVETANRTYALAMHPDGRRMLTGDAKGNVTIWKLENGEQIKSYKLTPSVIQEIDVSPDGKSFVLAGDGRPIMHVDLETGKSLRQFPGYTHKSAQFSPDGRFVAVSGPFSIIEVATGKTIARLPSTDEDYGLWTVRFSPDGRSLLTAGGSVYDKTKKGFVLQDDYAVRHWRLPESVWPAKAQPLTLEFDEPASPIDFKKGELHRLLSEAAGIPAAEFRKLTTDPRGRSPDHVTGEPLSYVLLLLNTFAEEEKNPLVAKDFTYTHKGVPKPSDLAVAASKSLRLGYASLIQPEYIQRTPVTIQPNDTTIGSVEFEAKDIYKGKVNFRARIRDRKWVIDQFTLPNYRITIELNDKGEWARIHQTSKVTGHVTLDGEALLGAEMHFYRKWLAKPKTPTHATKVITSIEDATYTTDLAPGEYRVTIVGKIPLIGNDIQKLVPEKYRESKMSPLDIEIKPGDNMFNFELQSGHKKPDFRPPGAEISGVATLDGKPIAGAKLTFYSLTDDETKPVTTTNDDGSYAIKLKHAGPYKVTVQKEKLIPEKYGDIRTTNLAILVKGGGNSFNFELRSSVGTFSIASGVVTLNGEPVEGAELKFHSFEKLKEGESKPTAKTNEEGAFEVKLNCCGQYRVTVAKDKRLPPKYSDAKTTELVIALQKGENNINFRLRR